MMESSASEVSPTQCHEEIIIANRCRIKSSSRPYSRPNSSGHTTELKTAFMASKASGDAYSMYVLAMSIVTHYVMD
ncbi:hypothetical protein TgHK011_000264 [Trichoderma gracile]|nr:hypothetical protein TgHK011_000264 [Trichoderma gracile]